MGKNIPERERRGILERNTSEKKLQKRDTRYINRYQKETSEKKEMATQQEKKKDLTERHIRKKIPEREKDTTMKQNKKKPGEKKTIAERERERET